MLPEAVAVPPNVDDVAMMDEPVDQGRRHHVVPEDLAPLLEPFVAREDGRRVFVAPGEQLEEQHGPGPRDREIADLVNDHQTRKDERPEAVREPAAALRLFERVGQISERREVDPSAVLRGGDREPEREMRFADAGWAEVVGHGMLDSS